MCIRDSSYAGTLNQPAQSIIINGANTALNGTYAGLYINPIRLESNVANLNGQLFYNTTSSEVVYSNTASATNITASGNISAGGIISATGNITSSANIIATGSIFGNGGGTLSGWTAGTVTIAATGGAITFPTNNTGRSIFYRQLGNKQWEVLFNFQQTPGPAGANSSTGDFLICLLYTSPSPRD